MDSQVNNDTDKLGFPDSEENTITSEIVQPSYTQKIGEMIKSITLEPAIFFHMVAFKMFYLTLQNIMLEKACRVNLNYTTEICDALTERDTEKYEDEEDEVQKFVADIITWKSPFDNFFPILFVLFAGGWSDRYGRKPLIIFPLLGYILQTTGILICTLYESIGAYAVALTSAIPVALTGSIATFNLAVFSYLADITRIENRTVRTGIANGAFLLGMGAGTSLGGLLSTTSLGFPAILAVSGVLDIAALLYVIIRVRNIKPKGDPSDSSQLTSRWKNIFNIRNVIDAGKTVLKKRENLGRLNIFLLIFACYFFITVPEYGEEAVFYLFLRKQLNWDGGNYGTFATYKLFVGFMGGIMAMGLLSYKLKLSDPIVGIICSISQFSASFVYAFAKRTSTMYLGPAVDMWNSTMSLITKVILSKLVPTFEIGKIYSFIGCVDAVIPLVANPMYSTLYKATLDTFPGAFFFLSAAMTLSPFGVFVWMIGKVPKTQIEEQSNKHEKGPTEKMA